MWIDYYDVPETREVGFLIETSHETDGWERYELSDRPPYTNQSHEPRPLGWCGSYNNVSTTGRGVWRVVKALPNGRAKLERVADPEALEAFLEETGYPGLLGELTAEETA